MSLREQLEAVAEAARAHAEPGEEVAAVIPAEPAPGLRVHLCAYELDGRRTWLALDSQGEPLEGRALLRDAVSIAVMCELAEEAAAGGDLDELRAQLVAVRLTEHPPGIEEAERAVDELQRAIGAPPRVASPAHLDAVGAATRRLEEVLGEGSGSPFANALAAAAGAVEELWQDVETAYKRPLR